MKPGGGAGGGPAAASPPLPPPPPPKTPPPRTLRWEQTGLEAGDRRGRHLLGDVWGLFLNILGVRFIFWGGGVPPPPSNTPPLLPGLDPPPFPEFPGSPKSIFCVWGGGVCAGGVWKIALPCACRPRAPVHNPCIEPGGALHPHPPPPKKRNSSIFCTLWFRFLDINCVIFLYTF